MPEDSSEQQELSDVDAESATRTRQEQIIDLYNANDLPHIAVGYWAKLIVEAVIVAVPLAVFILLPGMLLAFLGVGPFTYGGVLTAWIAFSTTVLGFSWCLTEAVISTDDAMDSDEDESQD